MLFAHETVDPVRVHVSVPFRKLLWYIPALGFTVIVGGFRSVLPLSMLYIAYFDMKL